MSYFVWGPFGWVECDRNVIDGLTPTLDGKRHPNPQHWHDLRKRAKERDGWRCVTCNAKEPLEVHHRYYGRWGYEELQDVYTLCRECHKTFHRERKLTA